MKPSSFHLSKYNHILVSFYATYHQTSMQQILTFLIVFLAVFTQSLSGFGMGLVAMALLPGVLSIRVASPLIALVGGSIEIVLLIRYRQALNLKAVWRLVLASLFGVPLGVWALRNVGENIIITLLGIMMIGYALYGLLEFKLPELNKPVWAYGLGFLAGALGGAYNTSGPPVIIYGNCRGWLPGEFKSNLQGFFLVNTLVVITGHTWSHNLTGLVFKEYLLVFPAIVLGIITGISLDRFINQTTFREIVFWLLIAMGLRLAYSGIFSVV
jgi:uncharacterized membrane protein YfcA